MSKRLSSGAAFWILAIVTVAGPAIFLSLGWRESSLLDRLADEGVESIGVVDEVNSKQVVFQYSVNGTTYRRSVRRDEGPNKIGASVAIMYLPSAPVIVRPTLERRLIREEANGNRVFQIALAVGMFVVLGLVTFQSRARSVS